MKYLNSKLVLIGLVALVFSCEAPKEQKEEQTKEVAEAPKTPFEKSLAFHGGLSKWNEYGTLQFDRLSARDTVTHILDLKNRNEKIISPANTLTFTESGYWINPDNADEQGNRRNPRFFRNLWFYFFGLPFVTADPGANQEAMADGELNGNTYDRVKITFGEGVGDAPDDQYILWLNKENGQLELINYSVTYGKGKEASENYNAIVFTDWQDVNGIKVPSKFNGHVWQGDSLGDVRYSFQFNNVSFSKDRPAASTFDKPEAAYYEDYE